MDGRWQKNWIISQHTVTWVEGRERKRREGKRTENKTHTHNHPFSSFWVLLLLLPILLLLLLIFLFVAHILLSLLISTLLSTVLFSLLLLLDSSGSKKREGAARYEDTEWERFVEERETHKPLTLFPSSSQLTHAYTLRRAGYNTRHTHESRREDCKDWKHCVQPLRVALCVVCVCVSRLQFSASFLPSLVFLSPSLPSHNIHTYIHTHTAN